MQKYLHRIPLTATAPHDLVALNERLISGGASNEDVARWIEEEPFNHSWWGVLGGFRTLSERVHATTRVAGSSTVRIVKPLAGNREKAIRPGIPGTMKGWLSSLAVVKVDYRLDTEANTRLREAGARAVIAAELHNSSEGDLEGSVSYVALSAPDNFTGKQIPTAFWTQLPRRLTGFDNRGGYV